MKKTLLLFLCFLAGENAHSDVKLSQLPLGNVFTTNANDSFPYVDYVNGVTRRLRLSDLINLPPLVATYAPLSSPTFTGVVTAPTFVGALTGNASTASAFFTTPVPCSLNTFAKGINANGDLVCTQVQDAALSTVYIKADGTRALTGAWNAGQNITASAFFGPLTGNVIGNLTGNVTGNVTGTASGNTTYTPNQYGVVTSGSTNAMSVIPPNSSTSYAFISGGSAASPSWGVLSIAGGGTGQVTKAASFDALSPNSTLGDITYYGSSTNARLAGNTTATKKFLVQTGTGSVSNAPSWDILSPSDLPNPSSSTLGGVQSFAAQTSKWINSISTSGVPSATQPAFNDISGSVAASQMPALSGDVTTSAGSTATTISTNAVSNSKAAQMPANTLKGNNTGSTANASDLTVSQAQTLLGIPTGSSPLSIALGGTGQTTANASLNALLPTQTGNANKVLVTDGTNTAWSYSKPITQVKHVAFTASGTYTPTAGMVYCNVEIVGGGGGGGGVLGDATKAAAAGGGGAGAYTRKVFTAATIGASQTVTIGAAGAGGAIGTNNGTAGGSSSFGALLVVGGGGGGVSPAPATGFNVGGGGAGGTVSTAGDFSANGELGSAGASNGTAVVLSSARGGASFFGGGGGYIPNQAGQAATAWGAGGGGASQVINPTGSAGGAGAGGAALITEFISN